MPSRARQRHRVEENLEPDRRPVDAERRQHAGMNLAELRRASSARASACRRGRGDTRPADRRRPARCRPRRPAAASAASASALAMKRIDRPAGIVPAFDAAAADAQARSPSRPGPPACRRDIAGRSRTSAASGSKPRSALRCAAASEIGQDRGPHRVEVGADRIDEAQRLRRAAEQRRLRRRQEGKGHRLDQAARGEAAAHEIGAALRRRRAPASAARVSRGERHGRNVARSRGCAALPRRDRPRPRCRRARTAARPTSVSPSLGRSCSRALRGCGAVRARRDRARPASACAVGAETRCCAAIRGTAPAVRDLARLAAAQLQDQPRRELDAGPHEFGIEAALEAIARVALDAELAAGRGGAHRIEQRRLDEHVGGRVGAAGALAADDAAEARARRYCRRSPSCSPSSA